jgi:glycerate kinase
LQKDTQTAYIEMAKSSGLMLLKENEKNPLKTTTFGTG